MQRQESQEMRNTSQEPTNVQCDPSRYWVSLNTPLVYGCVLPMWQVRVSYEYGLQTLCKSLGDR